MLEIKDRFPVLARSIDFFDKFDKMKDQKKTRTMKTIRNDSSNLGMNIRI
jgi:hypothetical protein